MKSVWPDLKFAALQDSITTVQLWTQIVGKIRLVKMPWINHSWHVTLYISPRGLTTGSMPCVHGVFQIDFDFIVHQLTISTSSGSSVSMQLQGKSVALFYNELMRLLHSLGIDATIYPKPNELEEVIPFADDEVHATYDPQQVHSLWSAWVNIHNVFTAFRARFTGKCSPVHLFWGAFDLAVTRFSGRAAPLHPGGAPNMPLNVMQEAYSHEVSSCGFWPGSAASPSPAFYAYCYPANNAFSSQPVQPAKAFYSAEMGEFFLLYEDVIASDNPGEYLMQFLQTTYEAAANTLHWDRDKLEADLTVYERKNEAL